VLSRRWWRLIAGGLGIVGIVLIGWLLLTGPSMTYYSGTQGLDEWSYREDGEIQCTSVLAGMPNDPDELNGLHDEHGEADLAEGVYVEDDPERDQTDDLTFRNDWVTVDCGRLRQQRLGQALLVGLPVVPLLGFAAYAGPSPREIASASDLYRTRRDLEKKADG
jgi:hypothetical protein